MSKGKLSDKDNGYRELVRRVYGLRKPKLKVGIFDAEGDVEHVNSSVTVLEVAIWNEFGTATIPERSFLRAWFDENQDKCRQAVTVMLQGVVKGKYTKEQALDLLGQRFVAEIQKRMAAGIPPANAPSTAARKGSSTPLIDSGQLRSSITYKVEDS